MAKYEYSEKEAKRLYKNLLIKKIIISVILSATVVLLLAGLAYLFYSIVWYVYSENNYQDNYVTIDNGAVVYHYAQGRGGTYYAGAFVGQRTLHYYACQIRDITKVSGNKESLIVQGNFPTTDTGSHYTFMQAKLKIPRVFERFEELEATILAKQSNQNRRTNR